MNSLFESRVRYLEENELPVFSKGCFLRGRSINLDEGSSRYRSLTELYWRDGFMTACALDGTVTQSIYTSRTGERSSGARNIRSPRNTQHVGINIIQSGSIFCPEFGRTASISNNTYEDLVSIRAIQNPHIYVDGFLVQQGTDDGVYLNETIKGNLDESLYITQQGDVPPARMTHEYMSEACTFEISFDLRRVYVYATDLIRRYYSGITVSNAISAFALDVAGKLGLPFTNLYPLIKQWMLDSHHPIIAFRAATELTVYMIPRMFTVQELETLKHIILQRFDVVEIALSRTRN